MLTVIDRSEPYRPSQLLLKIRFIGCEKNEHDDGDIAERDASQRPQTNEASHGDYIRHTHSPCMNFNPMARTKS